MDENCGESGEWGAESGEMALERQCNFNVTSSTCTGDGLTNYEECQDIAPNSSLGVLVWFKYDSKRTDAPRHKGDPAFRPRPQLNSSKQPAAHQSYSPHRQRGAQHPPHHPLCPVYAQSIVRSTVIRSEKHHDVYYIRSPSFSYVLHLIISIYLDLPPHII